MTPTTFLALLTAPYALAVLLLTGDAETHPSMERLAAVVIALWFGGGVVHALHLLVTP